jgi:hypothetical protein
VKNLTKLTKSHAIKWGIKAGCAAPRVGNSSTANVFRRAWRRAVQEGDAQPG